MTVHHSCNDTNSQCSYFHVASWLSAIQCNLSFLVICFLCFVLILPCVLIVLNLYFYLSTALVYGWMDGCANIWERATHTQHIHSQIINNYIDWAHTFFFSWQLKLYRHVLVSPMPVLCASMYLYRFSANSNNNTINCSLLITASCMEIFSFIFIPNSFFLCVTA